MPSKGTRPTQVRLTASELSDVEELKEALGLRTTSDVIRQGIATLKRAAALKPRIPKSGKKSD